MTFEDAAEKALTFRDNRVGRSSIIRRTWRYRSALRPPSFLRCSSGPVRTSKVTGEANRIREELADVAIYCIYMADAIGIDLASAVSDKIDANGRKYPADKARGSARKYTEL